MDTSQILSAIDNEIARLQQARTLLTGAGTHGQSKPAAKPRRRLSAAARKRIAAAQRKRWAAVRKGAK